MPGYTECAATSQDGPTFESPTIGRFVESSEGGPGSGPQGGSGKYKGGESLKRVYSELSGIAPEDLSHAEQNILNHIKKGGPDTHKRILGELVGIDDSDLTHAEKRIKGHLQASTSGQAGKQNPIPGIPNKQDQPDNDIHTNKPTVRLTSRRKESSEGGPGSGPNSNSGGTGKILHNKSQDFYDPKSYGPQKNSEPELSKEERIAKNRAYKAPFVPKTLSMMTSKRKRESFDQRLASLGRESSEGGPGSGPRKSGHASAGFKPGDVLYHKGTNRRYKVRPDRGGIRFGHDSIPVTDDSGVEMYLPPGKHLKKESSQVKK